MKQTRLTFKRSALLGLFDVWGGGKMSRHGPAYKKYTKINIGIKNLH
jgi:hypothetical protein